ncbi:hypothetical protein ACJRW5_02260 [Pseudomonas sp. SH1-B]
MLTSPRQERLQIAALPGVTTAFEANLAFFSPPPDRFIASIHAASGVARKGLPKVTSYRAQSAQATN